MKKFLALLLVLVIGITAGIGGTVAYLTDTEEAVNVMTVGNVSIEQIEQERDASGNLVPFTQAKPAYPAYGPIAWADEKITINGEQYKVFTENLKGVVDKIVTVENTGNSDAYIRTIVALEAPDFDPNDLIHINHNDVGVTMSAPITATINGVQYVAFVFTYADALEAGAKSAPSLLQVFLDSKAENEDVAKFGDAWEILVLSQAVQAANFPNAETALKEAFGEANADNVQKWFGGDEFEVPTVVEAKDDKELDEAIKDGADILVLKSGNYIIPDSANGKTLTIIGNGDTVIATQDDGSYEGCDYSLDGATVTFENVVINTDSSIYTGYARCSATYNNCTINGTYTLYGDSVFNNCTFNVSGDVYNIWTWGASNATFNNCTFNSDGKAILLYGTVNTKLTVDGCTFNDNGGLTDLKAAIEIGNDYDKSYELIVNNTTVNGYEINDKGINTNTTLWGNKNSMGNDKLNVVVDGVDVY